MGLMVDRICAVGRSSGQMTVEFVAALPVLLAVAAISVNALAFFGWCAAFDDDFRDLGRVAQLTLLHVEACSLVLLCLG